MTEDGTTSPTSPTSPDGGTPRHVVVGVDGSDESTGALRWALAEARLTPSQVVAVAAWHWPASAVGIIPLTDVDLAAGARDAAQTAVDSVVQEGDAPVEVRVREGLPAPVLLEAARSADLLVVGSRGHGAFSGLLLGSVSQHCVSHATCPVVVVRSSAPA